jgi:hypothetical protein
MYFLPENLKTWFIGDGKFLINDDIYKQYGHTDAGYMRMLLLMGMPGIILYLFINFSILNELKKREKCLRWLWISCFVLDLVFFLKLAYYPFFPIAFLMTGYYHKRIKYLDMRDTKKRRINYL